MTSKLRTVILRSPTDEQLLLLPTDIDKCASQPCPNGYCTDGPTSYTCLCYSGFTGSNCESRWKLWLNKKIYSGDTIQEWLELWLNLELLFQLKSMSVTHIRVTTVNVLIASTHTGVGASLGTPAPTAKVSWRHISIFRLACTTTHSLPICEVCVYKIELNIHCMCT